jgi:hypothetical protein
VLLTIRGVDLPGRRPGRHVDVHVGLQVRREPVDLVPADATEAQWTVELDVVDRGGAADFRGPAVQGRPGERFVYLTWSEVHDGAFTMFRRLKIMLADPPSTTQDVIATVRLTDAGGMPLCARARPPHLSWAVAAGAPEPSS